MEYTCAIIKASSAPELSGVPACLYIIMEFIWLHGVQFLCSAVLPLSMEFLCHANNYLALPCEVLVNPCREIDSCV